MFQLKNYQKKTLDILQKYFEQVRFKGAEEAYHKLKECSAYNKIKNLENVPYVCLRLPTGGGKTYLAANTVSLAAHTYLETESPVVLWFCPTTTIKNQTLETLKNPRHPNREVLENAFGGDVLVFDIEDYVNVRAQDIENKCCIFVSTIQTFKIKKTNERKIYDSHENFESFFKKIPNLQNMNNLERFEDGINKGNVKYSFANILNLRRPLIIADEAHNNSTELAYETLQRINPSCIIEFTATPAANSNVLCHICAMELKAEEMIKLPIILTVHQTWEQSLSAAVQTRNALSELALKDKNYIRPIMLIQAENAGKEVTVDVIKNYLINQENIRENKIAVATGSRRELDGVNLFDAECPVEYIITIEALKEGWDCPFAYVFYSAAQRHSAKDIEQLLGRVLRMPYAKAREDENLNKAYAFVSNISWQEGVSRLKDRLVEMGFDESEFPSSVQTQLPQILGGCGEIKPIKFNVSNFDLSGFTNEEQENIKVTASPIGQEVHIKPETDITKELEEKIIQAVPKSERKNVEIMLELELKNKMVYERKTPSQKGESFIVPQLSLFIDGDWVNDYDEYFLDTNGRWLLDDYPAELSESEFMIRSTGTSIEININGNHIEDRYIQETTALAFDDAHTDWTVNELAIWITRQIPDANIKQQVQVEFIRRLLENLLKKREIALNDLVKTKFILKDAIKTKIEDCKKAAEQKGMQRILFNSEAECKTDFNYSIDFEGKPYIPSSEYRETAFNKHYYNSVGDMNKEELECARALDINDGVEFWVRNIEKYKYAFYIPMANGRFYPDFAAKLKDGRILAVEYKGEHLATNADTENKTLTGNLWAKSSQGRCLFLLCVKKNEIGSIYEQINNIIKSSV